ncbi:MAG: 5-dehydro-4-deoxyglucarate dehydratase [Bryobacterales bacterium]|nr:5-dehydro-4-deoxyglucarate dehydratase [Bryobacterales bacterium]MDE0292860.1 5-dehydro-4-deoxyglucarate dehydratase [Bryobacterales bacterium]MDE0433905.1 5-dehydro-4-deoxyglucarate dehydratase [Bryobacterales bacterium]
MTAEELKGQLGGVITFPVTIFKDDLSLDIEGYRQNVAEMLRFPLCAVVAAGGTGEMYSMTPEEHFEVIKATIEEVGGKTRVLAGVGFNMPLAVEMAKKAEEAGADGILCFPPYYPNADREGLLHYYKAIGEATNLGLFVYSRDWATFSATEVWRLCEAIPNLIAWKEGQADLRAYQRIMERCGDRLHWIGGIGDDMVPGYYSIGIRTYTSSIAVLSPRLSLQLHERASMLDQASLARLMSNYVIPLYALRARRKGYEVSVMKKAMEILGKPAGPVRPPLPEVRSEEVKEIEALMERFKPVL